MICKAPSAVLRSIHVAIILKNLVTFLPQLRLLFRREASVLMEILEDIYDRHLLGRIPFCKHSLSATSMLPLSGNPENVTYLYTLLKVLGEEAEPFA